MANANVNIISASSNTFQEWMIRDNNLANSLNELRNGNYYKDNGNITVANGSVQIVGTGTVLSVTGGATVSQQLTSNNIVNTNDLTVQGNNILFTSATGIFRSANSVRTKLLFSNTETNLANANVSGFMNLTATLLDAAPSIAIPNELAAFSLNNHFQVSNTGNVVMGGSIHLVDATERLNVAGNGFIQQSLSVTMNLSAAAANVAGVMNVATRIVSPLINVTTANVGSANIGTANVGGVLNVSTQLTTPLANLTTANIGTLSVTNIVAALANVTTANLGTVAIQTLLDAYNIWLDTAHSYSIVQGNAVFNNLTIQGTQTLVGSLIDASDTYRLRSGISSDGTGHYKVARNALPNADLRFFHTSNVWQVTANDLGTYNTIITTANLVNNFVSTSNTDVATAAALNVAYSAAIANATLKTANNGTFVDQRKGLNIRVSSGQLTLNVTANSSNTEMVDVTFDANSNNTFLNVSTTLLATAAAVNAAYSGAIANSTLKTANNGVFVVQRKGLNFMISSNRQSLNVTSNSANTELVDITLDVNSNDSILNASTQTVATSLAVNTAYGAARSNSVQKAGDTMTGDLNMAGKVVQNPKLAGYRENVQSQTVTGSGLTVDLGLTNVIDITLAGNPTITLSNAAPTGNMQSLTAIIRQSANGGNTVTFAGGTFRFNDNTVPVLTTTANRLDAIYVMTVNGGSIYYGAQTLANVPVS